MNFHYLAQRDGPSSIYPSVRSTARYDAGIVLSHK